MKGIRHSDEGKIQTSENTKSGSFVPQDEGKSKGENKKSFLPKRHIRALIVTPTRELAIQIRESFQAYGRHTGLRSTVVFGGVGQ